MGKVYAIGEMLIDFTPYGEEGVFKRNAGGCTGECSRMCGAPGREKCRRDEIGQRPVR